MPDARHEPAPLVPTPVRRETSFKRLRRMLLGSPMSSEHHSHTLLPKFLALPVFASDAISSVAYATQQIILALGAAGLWVASQQAAYSRYTMIVSGCIVLLLAIVVISYWQTIFAYPKGGGSYIVSKDNLGVLPGLVAAAAILIDYVLTVTWLGIILITLFLGVTYLAYDLGIVPREHETVVSQIARHVFGTGFAYYEIQLVTMLILLLAANTSFADFPRLAFFLARDRFIPRQFATQGDRLVFSNGIVILGGLAIVLLIIFGGDTHALIPLYAVGVFVSFTLSQASMVRRWLRLRAEGWWWRVWLNGLG